MKQVKILCLLLSVAGLVVTAACSDTSSLEPPMNSGADNSVNVHVTPAVDAESTSTASPVAAPTPTVVPTPPPSHEAFYELGQEDLSNDAIDSALSNLSKAIELKPDYVDAYYLRGLLFAREGDLDKAIADFEKVAELDPDFVDGRKAHSDVYGARGADSALWKNYDRAIADFERAIELDPDNSIAVLGAATAYYELGKEDLSNDKTDSALSHLSKAIELNPDYLDAYYLRGLIFAREEDFDKAIADFEKVVELDPGFAEGRTVRADIYGARGSDFLLLQNDYDRAIALFERAIELDPDNSITVLGAVTAYVFRGSDYLDEGESELAIADFDRAIPEFERIIKSDPEDAEAARTLAAAYLMRGIAYYEEGFYESSLATFDKAFPDLERALELDAGTAESRFVIADAYLLRGIYYEDENDLEGAIADFGRSVADFEIALSLDSDHSDAQYGLAEALLLLGIAHSDKEDYAQAIDLFERVIQIYPGNPEIEYFRGDARNGILKIEVERNEGVEWSRCEYYFKCGFVEVPTDYRDPDAGSIRIAVNVRRADLQDQRIGYLFVNPGGPGASGLELVQDSRYVFELDLLDRFDIIGFDPRGVGASEPEFLCGDPGEQLGLLNSIGGEIDSPEEIAIGEAAANLCIESMGPVGGLLHSEYVARDLDEVRKALGAEQISYLGFSYGSTLGVWYATLFPDSVRAMVLDGADNPVDRAATQQDRVEEAIEELAAFEELMEQALKTCDSAECPIYNEGDPIGYYTRAAEKLTLVNSAAGDVPDAGFLAVVTTLYAEALWPALWEGLFELNENDDPSVFLDIAEVQLGTDLTAPSFAGHVNCLDGLVLNPDLDRATRSEDAALIRDAIAERLPLIDAIFSLPPSACRFYDQFAPMPFAGDLDGGGVPILVVGNRTDAITSLGESEELVTETLSNGYLLETSHSWHVVYPDNDCVNEHVHRVLIDEEYPDRHVFCERED